MVGIVETRLLNSRLDSPIAKPLTFIYDKLPVLKRINRFPLLSNIVKFGTPPE